jgi:hypothetical protein
MIRGGKILMDTAPCIGNKYRTLSRQHLNRVRIACYATVMMEDLATNEASCVRTTVTKLCSFARYHNAPFSMTISACHACRIRQNQRRQTSKQLDR